jgi:SAM-dependent methyltransferase
MGLYPGVSELFMSKDVNLKEIWSRTRDVYQRRAERFDAERSKILFELKWLERFESLLPEKAEILDLGCGSGEPISQFFIERGFSLTGIDYAEPMIEIARQRYPESRWLVADMRSLNLETRFHGIIAWHSFFHLNPAEQPPTLELMARHLKPGGILMLTVGHEAGEVVGHVGGEKVYHSSLSPEEYQKELKQLGIEIVEFVLEDPECDFTTVLLAQKGFSDRSTLS